MALEGDKDFLKVPESNWSGCLWAIMVPLGAGTSIYQLWRDWQHHRFHWMHLIGLLVWLYMVALLWGAVHRAWKSARAKVSAEEAERDVHSGA